MTGGTHTKAFGMYLGKAVCKMLPSEAQYNLCSTDEAIKKAAKQAIVAMVRMGNICSEGCMV